MRDTEKLIEILEKNKLGLYHFTDIRNLASVGASGLLSMKTLRSRGLSAIAGGNEWSLDADRYSGMDAFVHLCFFRSHPMEWRARQDGRIEETKFLKVSPAVLRLPGVLITDGVANKSGMKSAPVEEAIASLDLEVIYTKTDWTKPEIKERLKVAKVREVLVPDGVPIDFIENLS